MWGPDTKIKAGDTMLAVGWEGDFITKADELPRFGRQLEGTNNVGSPVNRIIEGISDDMNFNENSVLVRLATTLDDLERATAKAT